MALSRLPSALVCAAILLVGSATSHAAELLVNGGFEGGTAGWTGSGISTAGCDPRSGSAALRISPSGPLAFAQQTVTANAPGTYTLAGWLKAESGSATVNVSMSWFDAQGDLLTQISNNVTAGAVYGPFSLLSSPLPQATSLRVRVSPSGGATVCIDDVSLDGPEPLAPTPTPSPTATAEPTQEPTEEPTSPASATAGPAASASATPTASATVRPLTFDLHNGGFEEGASGWEKFGGEFNVVASPRRSGGYAGELRSATSSTKWAYQVVRIDAADHYEFAGYLATSGGIERAFLRISWYASSDGSGSQLSTVDSTASLPGNREFTFLTTGSVKPPAGARSARVRIMLAPASDGPASVYMDDLTFGATAPPTPTPSITPSVTPQPSPTRTLRPGGSPTSAPTREIETSTPRPATVTAAVGPTDAPPSRSGAEVSEVGGVAGMSREADAAMPAGPLPRARDTDRGVPRELLVAGVVFVVGLGGSYAHSRRLRRDAQLADNADT